MEGQASLSHAVTCHQAKGGDPTTDNYVVTGGFFDQPIGTMACNTGPNGHDAGNFQSNQGVDSGYVIPVAFTQNSRDEVRVIGDDGLVSGSLSAETGTHQTTYITMIEQNTQASTPELPSIRANETPNYAVAYRVHGENSTAMTGDGIARVADPVDVARSLDTCGGYATNQGGNVVKQPMQVRRVTPVECERLQGIPDNFTKITEKSADGPRYKMIGNGFAVPCVAWIGKRIQMVEDMK